MLGVSYLVSVQDILTLNQSCNDSRKAVASLFLANEMARVRNSLAPGQDGSFIGLNYPTGSAPAVLEFANVPLVGTNEPAGGNIGGRIPFNATVRRKLNKSEIFSDRQIKVNSYTLELDVPQLKGNTMTNVTLSASMVRSFHDNQINP